jgi:hypothetical protein
MYLMHHVHINARRSCSASDAPDFVDDIAAVDALDVVYAIVTDPSIEPLLLAAVVFLAEYAIPIIHPELPPWLAAACRTTSLLVWVLFDPAIGHPGACGTPGHPARRRRWRARATEEPSP